ncbi:MAG: type II secretion system protein [Candidatus Saccharimonadales bacterium]
MKRGQQGFTIVELLVATLIIGVVTASISTLFISINTLQRKISRTDSATRAAQREIETLRNDNYAALVAGQTLNFTDQLPTSLPADRKGTVVVSEPSPDLKRVDVTVTYTDGGKQEKVVLSSLIGVIGITQ